MSSVEARSAQDARAIVRAFLVALEARDLPGAERFLAPDVTMTFPGSATFTSLEDLIAWARPRYRWVKKRIERIDDTGQVVHCYGTLYGEWPDGTPFKGIRFIDRFEIKDGKITRQDVWNDLAEAASQR